MIWKEYSGKYLKDHRVSSVSIMAAAFVSSLFISFITTLFYNMWVDSVRRAAERAGTGRPVRSLPYSPDFILSSCAWSVCPWHWYCITHL